VKSNIARRDALALNGSIPCVTRSSPAPGAAEDWTVPQQWNEYSDADHGIWDWLFHRQWQLMKRCAAREVVGGLCVLKLSKPGIPNFEELNRWLARLSGWQVVAVPGLIPDAIFYEHLSERRFPAARFIRQRNDIDYIAEPDVFHDVFGHVPHLAHELTADVMQKLGQLGLKAVAAGKAHLMARLYWHIVEFGLVREEGELKIFGAGLASSSAESQFALKSFEPVREPFSLTGAMSVPYRPDMFQPHYFVIEDLHALLAELGSLRW
jgi:phenylalanine-4-hydroxylase